MTSYKRFGLLKRQPDQHEHFQLELHPSADEIYYLDLVGVEVTASLDLENQFKSFFHFTSFYLLNAHKAPMVRRVISDGEDGTFRLNAKYPQKGEPFAS